MGDSLNTDTVDVVLGGMLGHFWKWDGPIKGGTREDALPGRIELADGKLEATMLVDDDETHVAAALASTSSPMDHALLAMLERATVMLPEVRGPSRSARFGAQAMANTCSYRVPALVVGVKDVRELPSTKLRSTSAVFPGMLGSAGLE